MPCESNRSPQKCSRIVRIHIYRRCSRHRSVDADRSLRIKLRSQIWLDLFWYSGGSSSRVMDSASVCTRHQSTTTSIPSEQCIRQEEDCTSTMAKLNILELELRLWRLAPFQLKVKFRTPVLWLQLLAFIVYYPLLILFMFRVAHLDEASVRAVSGVLLLGFAVMLFDLEVCRRERHGALEVRQATNENV